MDLTVTSSKPQGVLNCYLSEVEDENGFFQVSSSMTSFVSKILTRFWIFDTMIQSYLVEKIVYAHESQKSERFKYIRRCVHTHVFCLMHEQKVSAFIVIWIPDVRVDFWPPYWCTTVEHQHGGSIQNSIKLHEALRQISQKRCTAQTLELGRCSTNVSSTTFQVFGLFHWTV